MTKIYNKLVRDKIPEIIRAAGDEPKTRTLASAEEFEMAAVEKLGEEGQEFLSARTDEEAADELGDLEELVLALGAARGITVEQREAARLKKLAERGGFDERIYLESTE